MSNDPFNKVMRALDEMSDSQLASLALRSKCVTLETSEVVSHRYAGGRRLAPGLPLGLARNANNELILEHVAVVRVESEAQVRAAQQIIAKSAVRSAAFGVACGLATVAAVIGGWIGLQPVIAGEPGPVAAPCLITGITKTTVMCRQNDQVVGIAVNKFFPDGRYRLSAIHPGQNGFSVTRITDQRQFAFQADPKYFVEPTSSTQPKEPHQ